MLKCLGSFSASAGAVPSVSRISLQPRLGSYNFCRTSASLASVLRRVESGNLSASDAEKILREGVGEGEFTQSSSDGDGGSSIEV
eukprot:CAMPEP_0197454054 /NCGR_PEP_ID=MMETSP1175-20131217/36821_1 /TAXON_ID=1003142 /ORGANISM="Triceratium dubium, Strain CCMP147" /LENGTH=84 /DNA_ID=CAMNT_0042987529 /DNA_START=55 /DNA_END=305 /DNA_ORIENTATION=-